MSLKNGDSMDGKKWRDERVRNHGGPSPEKREVFAKVMLSVSAFLFATSGVLALASPDRQMSPELQATKRALLGQWRSIAPEPATRGNYQRSAAATPRRIVRTLAFLPHDRFVLTVDDMPDDGGGATAAAVVTEGRVEWGSASELVKGAWNVTYLLDGANPAAAAVQLEQHDLILVHDDFLYTALGSAKVQANEQMGFSRYDFRLLLVRQK